MLEAKSRTCLGLVVACLAVSVLAEDRRPVEEPRPPNIVLIVADDLGYADVGFHGVEDIPTPSLDALARRGVRFTNGYVSGTWCSPSRAGFLTGRYQQRFGESGHEAALENSLSLSETTLAERLQAAGYVTGLVGSGILALRPSSIRWSGALTSSLASCAVGTTFCQTFRASSFPTTRASARTSGPPRRGGRTCTSKSCEAWSRLPKRTT